MNSVNNRKSKSPPTVVVGVGAGIAAYKVAFLVRDFRAAGYDVYVVPTEASLNFVGKGTWRELSENPVSTEVFDPSHMGHIELARRADLVVVAPATADLLAKLRLGLADDLLTTTILATFAPLLVAPAMHTGMWENAATQENVAVLRERGVTVMTPEVGALSSGDVGPGRMPEPATIAALAHDLLASAHAGTSAPAGFSLSEEDEGDLLPLRGRHVVITAGGTQEPIDPVRYVGNRSSGHQGGALARAALDLGAEVTMVAASMTAPLPQEDERFHLLPAPTAAIMAQEVDRLLPTTDALVMAAAVADFSPENISPSKIKKTPDTDRLTIHMVRTRDILATVSSSPHRPSVLVGFGAETGTLEEVEERGRAKAVAKGADLLAVNQVGEGLGFGSVPTTLTYFGSTGDRLGSTSGSKDEVAADLMSRIATLLESEDRQ